MARCCGAQRHLLVRLLAPALATLAVAAGAQPEQGSLSLGATAACPVRLSFCSTATLRALSLRGMGLHGDVSDAVLAALCRLDAFDLGDNPQLKRDTVAGFLACTCTNLSRARRVDAAFKGLKGALLGRRF